jgi:chromosome segregation ATPase
VLEDYRDLIDDATNDLQGHMQRLELQVQAIVGDGAAKDGEKSVSEWQAILEEKTSTQHGLLLCAQLSAQIERFQSTSQESSTFTDRPSAYKYMKSGLESAKGSIQSIVSRLETHEDEVDRQLEVLSSSVGPMPEDAREQLARLQETKQSLRQCINVVADASHTLAEQRHNVFEDITMADDSYDFSVSTVGDLVTARRLTLKGRSRHVGGQLSDESYQKTIDAITTLDLENLKRMQHSVGQTVLGSQIEDTEATKQFSSRYGPGVRLPPS